MATTLHAWRVFAVEDGTRRSTSTASIAATLFCLCLDEFHFRHRLAARPTPNAA
jgi:hypothetical protein